MDRRINTLLRWYRAHGRSLPWRSTRNAYRIFMSELMLQQTQVLRVIPKYKEWLRLFPTWNALANSKTAPLLHAWAGLGYNRRALQAREAAQTVVRDGEPITEAGWRTLKGVGPYMAAALTEFANHHRAIVIDTNVRRVVGRVFRGMPHPTVMDDESIHAILDKVTPHSGRHWDIPQAFMDLGSSICTVRNPACATCPLRSQCKAAPIFLAGGGQKTRSSKPRERIHAEKPHPDRIYRGRILALVRAKKLLNPEMLGTNFDPDFDPIRDAEWRNAMIARLIKDGLLAMRRDGTLSLPQ
ncbi:MAG: A/G-specific adenine glycosylase [Patescibacteria group bacterium]